jgi:zinc D-Ala-D-Ala carboxypeptidase
MATDLLSLHLTVPEFLATSHRAFHDEQLATWNGTSALRQEGARFAAHVFEPVRTLLGVPLHVTSGYRCGGLNNAVGGRPTSRHVLALAADVVPIGLDLEAAMRRIAASMKAGHLPGIDEAIIEMGWIHLQAAPLESKPRQLALVTTDGRHFEAFGRIA